MLRGVRDMGTELYSANENENRKESHDRKRINIMTSSDNNLTNYIFVQLRNISVHLSDKEIHFYLLYNRIPKEKLKRLEMYSEFLGNITFHSVFVEDIEPYNELAKNGTGIKPENSENTKTTWPAECYFTIGCQEYLPKELDRILYIDAGDVIIMGDIDEFYFEDFGDDYFIVTQGKFKDDSSRFTEEDLEVPELEFKVKSGMFNSGAYMINLEILRKEDVSVDKALKIAETMPLFKGWTGIAKYTTDEGFISYAYIGRIKGFAYSDEYHRLYMPYNFTLRFFTQSKKELWYEPKIIHFVGLGDFLKPWIVQNIVLENSLIKNVEEIDSEKILEIAVNTKYGDFIEGLSDEIAEMPILKEGPEEFYKYWLEEESRVIEDFALMNRMNK